MGVLAAAGAAGLGCARGALAQCYPPAPTGNPDFVQAAEREAARSDQPEHARMNLLARIILSPACYPGDLTPEQLDQLMAASQMLPPGARGAFGPRFLTDNSAWVGAGQIGASNLSRAAQLTYSFPDDGVTWGITCSGFGTGGNNLNLKLTSTFGSVDRGREMIRSGLASWRSVGGLTYTEVADDNSTEDVSLTHVSTRGDIRIGGWGFGALGTSPLAYNAFPNSPLSSCNGGDMTINTNYFTSVYFSGTIGNFLYFRNTVAHEHGHGLGFYHTVPCNMTKLMEPSINTVVNMISSDEVRAVIRDYGDRFNTVGNHSGAAAKDFGNLTTPAVRSVIQKDLGINGTGFAEEDWFKFTIDTPQSVTITVTPTGYSPMGACCVSSVCTSTTQVNCTGTWAAGISCTGTLCTTGACCTGAGCSIVAQASCSGTFVVAGSCNGFSCVAPSTTTSCAGGSSDPSCCQGSQTSGCSGGSSLVSAQSAANIALELRNGTNGSTVVLTSNSNFVGVTETVSSASLTNPPIGMLSAGTYWVRVWDAGGGIGWAAANQTIQSYELAIRVGTSKAPPMVIAGLQHKRVLADTTCQFIGNHNSYATEAGATLPSANFAWDLDGDGTFETTAQTQPQFTYRSNATFNVTLRVTDTNGSSATDTIQVLVYGATTTITSTSPNNGVQGASVPVTIIGSNFKGVTNASQVAVSGTGVTVSGTPVVNGAGTRITGLSFLISGAAPIGARDVIVTNSDGQGAVGAGTGVFTVNPVVSTGACCALDGTCGITTQGGCSASFQGLGTVCSPNPCPQPNVACCALDGGCTFVVAAACSGAAQPFGSVCTPNPCTQPSVACCETGGVCMFLTVAACTGTALGVGSVCQPNPCPQPNGACCIGGSCSIRTAGACTGAYSHFAGVGTSCNAPADYQMPCCVADFNKDAVISSQDIFDFLNGWFLNDPASDLGADGLTIQDVFDFLNAWFAGC